MAISTARLVTLFEDNTKEGLIFKQELNNNLINYVVNISHSRIDSICELVIACQSKLLLKNLEKTFNYDINQGFLIHEWSIDHLKELLSSSTSSLICTIDHEKNQLAGYLLLASVNHLVEHISSKDGQFQLDENVITGQQWKQLISSPHIQYIEQTGIDPEYHRRGIGSNLITLAKNHSKEGLCTCVTVWPHCNDASVKLKTKNGFKPVGTWHQITSSELGPFKATIFIWSKINQQTD